MSSNRVYNKDIIMYSIVNLSRNVEKIPFPQMINIEQFRTLSKYIEKIFINEEEENEFVVIYKDEEVDWIKENNILGIIEEVNRPIQVLSNTKRDISIILNQKDHILLSAINNGLDFDKLYKNINYFDDEIEEYIEYAFDENLGYLTAIPNEIGCGLKLGVIIHLPSISLNNNIKELKQQLQKEGVEMLPMYVNGIEEIGYIYKVFINKIKENSELEIIKNFKAIIYKIILQEKNIRNNLLQNKELELKDMVFRALGLIKSFYLIDLCEAIRLISYIRFGVEIGFISNINLNDIDNLFFQIQPMKIQEMYGEKLNRKEINIKRAEFLREWIENL
ncbi:MAG: hypothetical protein ACRC7R_08150 [Sarcina sp.]